MWLSVLICGMVYQLAKIAIFYLEKRMPIENERISTTITWYLKMYKSTGHWPNLLILTGYWRSIRSQFILNGTQVLMAAILSMAYASTVVSFLTARKLNPIANSIEYFANNPDKELVMIKEYQLTGYILVRFILFRCFWFSIFCFLLSYQQSNSQEQSSLNTFNL